MLISVNIYGFCKKADVQYTGALFLFLPALLQQDRRSDLQ